MATYIAPKLYPIDPEMLLFGKIHLEWENVGAPVYYVFRDYDEIKNVSGWQPYGVVEDGSTSFDDSAFENNRVYYYAICAVAENGINKSEISNSEKIKVHLPENLIVNRKNLEEAAYYESKAAKNYNDKLWELARLRLIFKNTFPDRNLDYLESQVKSLKRDLPEFTGLFMQPTESEIQKEANYLRSIQLNSMNLDWDLSEFKLIKKKIEDLIEYETEVR